MTGAWVMVATWCTGLLLAGDAAAQSLKDVFHRTNPAVVLVQASGGTAGGAAPGGAAQAQGLGSGVLVSADGKVVTAAHVVKGATTIEVSFLDGAPIPATIMTLAPFADLALLQLARVPPGATVATFGDSDLLDVGDQVYTIGAPYGANHSMAVGWISARREGARVYEDALPLEVFQTDLSIFEGNSGGALFNLSGEVVGIVTHVLTQQGGTSGPSFSVAGNVVKRLLVDERRTWFGIESVLLEGPLAAAFNLPQQTGLLVQTVAPGSLAARLGLRGGMLPAVVANQPLQIGGDVLLEILGTPVTPSPTFMSNLLGALDRLRPGDPVNVRVWRGGQVVPLSVSVSP